MKKLLTLLTSIGLISTTPAAITMTSFNTHMTQSEVITSVKSDNGYWKTETGGVNPTNGHELVHNQWDISLSKYAPDFDTIRSDFKYITLDGVFDWGTYKEPVVLNTLRLVEGPNEFKNNDEIEFIFSRQEKASNGWGHQQSNIAIKINVIKTENGQATIHLETWAEAASQASVHKCHTSINISTISFIA